MQATYRRALCIDEALDAEAEAIDSFTLERCKACFSHLAGGTLYRAFHIRFQAELMADGGEDAGDDLGFQKGRSASAKVDGIDARRQGRAKVGSPGAGCVHFFNQSGGVALDAVGGKDPGCEVAKAALGFAERNGNIEASSGIAHNPLFHVECMQQ